MVSIPNNHTPQQGMNWVEFRRAYATFMDNPAQGILHIIAAGRNTRWDRKVMARLRHQACLIVDHPVTIDLHQLQQLPPDTLGGAYARHMLAQGFTPDAFATPMDDAFDNRLGIAHDVQHIITGFDSTPIGEYGLAAFMLVQYRDLLNVFVLSWVPWSMLGSPRSIPKLLASLARGFYQGWRSRPLVAYPFEENWEKPIGVVRRELGIC